MPDVSEIIDGLRRRGLPVWAPSARLGVGAEPSLDGEMVVPLADAEAAVRSAVDARTTEIVGALRERDAPQPDNECATCGLLNPGPEHRANAPALCNADRTRDYAHKRIEMLGTPADFIARRFPNGGTNNGE